MPRTGRGSPVAARSDVVLNQLVVHVATPERMRALGEAFGQVAEAGDRLLLEGPFGAGKTTFVQGLALGLEVPTPISSPSFVIENQYRGRLVLYHVDLFRLERLDPELSQGLEEHMYGEGVAAVEWAERLPAELRDGATLMRFELLPDGRRVTVATANDRFETAARSAT